jgi:hypothetical protein
VLREHARDVANDPRTIVTHELQMERSKIDGVAFGASLDDDGEGRGESLQFRGKRVGAVRVDADA